MIPGSVPSIFNSKSAKRPSHNLENDVENAIKASLKTYKMETEIKIFNDLVNIVKKFPENFLEQINVNFTQEFVVFNKINVKTFIVEGHN